MKTLDTDKKKRIKDSLILKTEIIDSSQLLPHEKVISERAESLYEYLNSIESYIILPSILVCSESNMIIDGHHRFHVLQRLKINQIPVTYINYHSKRILTNPNNYPSKEYLIQSAKEGNLLQPKSSEHKFLDHQDELQPILLLAQLSKVKC